LDFNAGQGVLQPRPRIGIREEPPFAQKPAEDQLGKGREKLAVVPFEPCGREESESRLAEGLLQNDLFKGDRRRQFMFAGEKYAVQRQKRRPRADGGSLLAAQQRRERLVIRVVEKSGAGGFAWNKGQVVRGKGRKRAFFQESEGDGLADRVFAGVELRLSGARQQKHQQNIAPIHPDNDSRTGRSRCSRS
jgi:hypothetical protein